jgi:hypothetical protein
MTDTFTQDYNLRQGQSALAQTLGDVTQVVLNKPEEIRLWMAIQAGFETLYDDLSDHESLGPELDRIRVALEPIVEAIESDEETVNTEDGLQVEEQTEDQGEI